MEFEYQSTIVHQGVLFYIADGGDRAYFVHGGCIVSVHRRSREIGKFGLTLRGNAPGNRVVANYVRTELARLGRAWAAPQGSDDVFVDALGLLLPLTELDLCGRAELDVYDPYLVECMVSLPASALSLTLVHDRQQDRVLELLAEPAIVHPSSGFVYAVNEACFALVQAYLSELPSSLQVLTEGLFDGIPGVRPPLSGETRPTAVVVKGGRAAPTLSVRPRRYAERALRATVVSDFVQVRYIPATRRIWATRGGSLSLQMLCDLVAGADAILRRAACASDDASAAVVEAVSAVAADPFFGTGSTSLTGAQRFALYQFILARWHLPSCYAALEGMLDTLDERPGAGAGDDEDGGEGGGGGGNGNGDGGASRAASAVAHAVNRVLREATVFGEVMRMLVNAAVVHAPALAPIVSAAPAGASPPTTKHAREDAATGLELAVMMSDAEANAPAPGVCELVEAAGARVLDGLYAGRGLVAATAPVGRALRLTSTVCAEAALLTAFGDSPAALRGAQYLFQLFRARLARANISIVLNKNR
ncbi:UL21 [Suid alphaherpesvirus 1]|nr:UL21 [Suid alphaherpesvirus 1]